MSDELKNHYCEHGSRWIYMPWAPEHGWSCVVWASNCTCLDPPLPELAPAPPRRRGQKGKQMTIRKLIETLTPYAVLRTTRDRLALRAPDLGCDGRPLAPASPEMYAWAFSSPPLKGMATDGDALTLHRPHVVDPPRFVGQLAGLNDDGAHVVIGFSFGQPERGEPYSPRLAIRLKRADVVELDCSDFVGDMHIDEIEGSTTLSYDGRWFEECSASPVAGAFTVEWAQP